SNDSFRGGGLSPEPRSGISSYSRSLSMKSTRILALLALAAAVAAATPVIAKDATKPRDAAVAVAPQYDTTHVYVAPDDVDKFAASFLATFGGKSTKQVVATVTPAPSSTTSQLLQTPAGTVSLFGFK